VAHRNVAGTAERLNDEMEHLLGPPGAPSDTPATPSSEVAEVDEARRSRMRSEVLLSEQLALRDLQDVLGACRATGLA